MDRPGSAFIARRRRPRSRGLVAFRIVLVAFALQWGLIWVRLWLAPNLFGSAQWPEGLFIVLATVVTLANASRHLPAQNVALASGIIVLISSGTWLINAPFGLPLGPVQFQDNIGYQLRGTLPWTIPLLWIVLIFGCRGTARLILRRWRNGPFYGYWLIGVTTALVLLLDLGLEPFATRVRRYWTWGSALGDPCWFDTPWVNFLGWNLTAVVILVLATPVLINKKPVVPAPDYFPFISWLSLTLLLMTGAAFHGLYLASGLSALQIVVVSALVLWANLPTKAPTTGSRHPGVCTS